MLLGQWKPEEEITIVCGGWVAGFLEELSFNQDLEDGKEFVRQRRGWEHWGQRGEQSVRSGAFLEWGGVASGQEVCAGRSGRWGQDSFSAKSLRAVPTEGAQQWGWDYRRHRAREEAAGSAGRKNEHFQRHLEAPHLCTWYLLGCVWLLREKPVAAG